jgi:ribose-phosphate pyrophosphokinase
MENNYKIFSTSTSKDLGNLISEGLDMKLGELHSEKFSDGEVFVRFDESVRGNIIFIVAQVNMPYENLFELFLTIDAAKRASAQEIICVTPYLPHSRQERRNGERASIAARMVADLIQQAGANRLITLDMHTDFIEGFYSIPVHHLDGSYIFAPHIRSHGFKEDLCLCSPDFGGIKRIKKYKKILECEMAVIHKERLKPNQVSHMEIIGNVEGKNVILIDDMIDTAGTLCKASEIIMEHGAKSVMAYCSHGLLNGNALEKIENSVLSKVFVTDSVRRDINSSKIEVLSCSKLLAIAVKNLLENKSMKGYGAVSI